ncbi:MAG: HEAT repeat domain-containing protein [archaeon]
MPSQELKREVLEAIRRFVNKNNKKTFSTHDLSKQELENIKENCNEEISNIGSKVNNILHDLEEEGIINIEVGGYLEYLEKENVFSENRRVEPIHDKNDDPKYKDGSKRNLKEKDLLSILKSEDDLQKARTLFSLQKKNRLNLLKSDRLSNYILNTLLVKNNRSLNKKIYWLINNSKDIKNFYVNSLLTQINEENHNKRKNALEILSNIDFDKSVEEFIIEKLKDDNFEVRLSALKCLIKKEKITYQNELFEILETWENEFKINRKKQETELKNLKKEKRTKENFQQNKLDKIEGDLTWNVAVKKAINKLVKRHSNLKFTRQSLIEEEMDYIKKATGTEGKAPTQSLSRVSQELWKEEDFLEHIEKGVYKMKRSNSFDIENENIVEDEHISKDLTKANIETEADIDDQIQKLITGLVEGDDQKQKEEKLIDLCSRNKDFLNRLTKKVDDFDWKSRYKVVSVFGNIEKNEAISECSPR